MPQLCKAASCQTNESTVFAGLQGRLMLGANQKRPLLTCTGKPTNAVGEETAQAGQNSSSISKVVKRRGGALLTAWLGYAQAGRQEWPSSHVRLALLYRS